MPLNHSSPNTGPQKKKIDDKVPLSCSVEIGDTLDAPVHACRRSSQGQCPLLCVCVCVCVCVYIYIYIYIYIIVLPNNLIAHTHTHTHTHTIYIYTYIYIRICKGNVYTTTYDIDLHMYIMLHNIHMYNM